jgi:hypothetical protein
MARAFGSWEQASGAQPPVGTPTGDDVTNANISANNALASAGDTMATANLHVTETNAATPLPTVTCQ